MAEELIFERIDGLAICRFNRPERMNALSPGIIEGMGRLVPELVSDPGVRAVMMTGTGRAFCAGADVGGLGGPPNPDRTRAAMRACHSWLKALRHSEKIVISAVNGVAAGGGFGLAMVADIVVAADDTFFKAAFTDLGVAADFGLGFTLPQAVGHIRAAEILFSDRRLTAREAVEIGMISRTFPADTFVADALELAQRMARTARGAQLTKRLLRSEEVEAFSRYLDLEADTQTEAFQTHDFREGVAAFSERRAPTFQGR